jgi:hypothetical protein
MSERETHTSAMVSMPLSTAGKSGCGRPARAASIMLEPGLTLDAFLEFLNTYSTSSARRSGPQP